MSGPIRVVIPTDSLTPQAWEEAEAYAAAIGEKSQPEVTDFVLLTHTQEQLKNTSLANHVGENRAKSMLGGQRVVMRTGGQLRHATIKTLRSTGTGAVIVAFFANKALLDFVDGLTGVVGIVAVPDLPTDADAWIGRWAPVVHGQQQGVPAQLIADPVLEKALVELTDRVNLSHALLNPRDKGYADETLRILRANGHTFEGDDIKSWAIQNGWKPGAAGELDQLARRIGGLKSKPSLAAFYDPQGKYDRWAA